MKIKDLKPLGCLLVIVLILSLFVILSGCAEVPDIDPEIAIIGNWEQYIENTPVLNYDFYDNDTVNVGDWYVADYVIKNNVIYITGGDYDVDLKYKLSFKSENILILEEYDETLDDIVLKKVEE